MYIILVYDICTLEKKGQRRLNKIMKLCRCYLHHSQKSVFEGNITEAKYRELKTRIKEIIDNKEDSLFFYIVERVQQIKRENLGKETDPTANIL
jgi:CRISPR-associated protein Cas2